MMTQAEFITELKNTHTEEKNDANHYMEMAKSAPTSSMRDMLYEIASDEIMHKAKLECMLMTLEGSIT